MPFRQIRMKVWPLGAPQRGGFGLDLLDETSAKSGRNPEESVVLLVCSAWQRKGVRKPG
jgi:hypothetical protein